MPKPARDPSGPRNRWDPGGDTAGQPRGSGAGTGRGAVTGTCARSPEQVRAEEAAGGLGAALLPGGPQFCQKGARLGSPLPLAQIKQPPPASPSPGAQAPDTQTRGPARLRILRELGSRAAAGGGVGCAVPGGRKWGCTGRERGVWALAPEQVSLNCKVVSSGPRVREAEAVQGRAPHLHVRSREELAGRLGPFLGPLLTLLPPQPAKAL